jgi:hypothetical protein
VPVDCEWPAELHGMKLLAVQRRTSNGWSLTRSTGRKLEAMGF